MSRYKAMNNWKVEAISVADLVGPSTAVIVERCDALDTKTGHEYLDGCYRVRTEGPIKVRTKRWYGESAWMNAERHAYDTFVAIQLGNV